VLMSVVIPTYRRPANLKLCLEALKVQRRQPDEIIIVVRDTDPETHRFLTGYLPCGFPLQVCEVSQSGVITALKAGIEKASGEVVCITDDDAIPREDWLSGIEPYFRDDAVGGVGGRDVIWRNKITQLGWVKCVGKVQWFGRVIGNHHLGGGNAQEVDILKGVNMSFRKKLWLFDERLLGTGAQLHFEMDLCLRARNLGWKLIYDPKIIVDHYPAPQLAQEQRDVVNYVTVFNSGHNEVYILLKHFSAVRRFFFFLYTFLLGNRANPGLFLVPWSVIKYGIKKGLTASMASLTGKAAGVVTYLRLITGV